MHFLNHLQGFLDVQDEFQPKPANNNGWIFLYAEWENVIPLFM